MQFGIEVVPFVHTAIRAGGGVGASGRGGWLGSDHALGSRVFSPRHRRSVGDAGGAWRRRRSGLSSAPTYRRGLLQPARAGVDTDCGSTSSARGTCDLGAGAGVDFDFTPVDPTTSPKRRAAILDESLAILAHLLAGEAVTYHGQHFSFENVQLVPMPVQRPRTPIWIGGDSKPAYRRAGAVVLAGRSARSTSR